MNSVPLVPVISTRSANASGSGSWPRMPSTDSMAASETVITTSGSLPSVSLDAVTGSVVTESVVSESSAIFPPW